MPLSITENASTGLGIRKRDRRELHRRGRELDAHRHAALLGELDGVREQVLQHLLEALLVREDSRWDVRTADLDRQLEALFGGQRAERALDELADLLQLYLRRVHAHLPGLDLRQVEDVVDQVQQVGAGVVDRVRELDLLLGQVRIRVVREQLREDEQRVQRRTKLVAHVREELALVLRRDGELLGALLQCGSRKLDLAVLDLDAAVLLREQLCLLLELLVRLLELLLLGLQELLGRLERLRLLLELGVRALQLLLLRLQLLGALLQLLRSACDWRSSSSCASSPGSC